MANCVICDKPGNRGIGGMIFCAVHAAEAQAWIEALREDGQPVYVARFVAQERRRVVTSISLRAEFIGLADDLARKRGVSRSRLIEDLIVEAGQGRTS